MVSSMLAVRLTMYLCLHEHKTALTARMPSQIMEGMIMDLHHLYKPSELLLGLQGRPPDAHSEVAQAVAPALKVHEGTDLPRRRPF